MSDLLQPAHLRVVRPSVAHEVISPPYDLLSRRERRRLAEDRPRSFLNATRSPDDFPEMEPAEVVTLARAYMVDRMAEGAYGAEVTGFFVYRLTAGVHSQAGVVGDVPLSAFPARVRPHETTRVDREDQLALHLRDAGFTSSPVGLTYRGSGDIDRAVTEVMTGSPMLDLEVDGERQQVWEVPAGIAADVGAAFSEVEAAYIIDGHHRVAAARRLVDLLGVDASHRAGRILAVAFPDHALHVYSYHRWVDADWPVAAAWNATEVPEPGPGEAIAVSAAGWMRLRLDLLPGELDSAALSRTVLAPQFGVTDERTDPRLVFVPGALGRATLEARVRRRGGVGFLLRPTSVEELMEVSDRGGVMPPKSTFFAPKPRSGIFLANRQA